MTSRLDRLFVLLESGSSSTTRGAAAKQIGEVQKLHPHELHTLLGRISVLLRASSWETRVAAAQAVAAVLAATPKWNPPSGPKDKWSYTTLSDRLRVSQLNVSKVLENSTHLMGSEGKEYDDEESFVIDSKERLAYQRQQLNARLGLDAVASIGIDFSEIVKNEDLQNGVQKTESSRKPVGEVLTATSDELTNLSSREINRARRKAKQAISKQRLVGEEVSSDENIERKRIKIDPDGCKEEPNCTLSVTPDATGSWGPDAIDWPLEQFCESLCAGLFDTAWETRHGCATALRELLCNHGAGGGRVAHTTSETMEFQHGLWLEDIASRLICVLALDRFGDFVSDAVVAPVRETAAQCLGAVLKLMKPKSVVDVKNALLQLLQQKEWEARHGGLLGIKYMLAIREDLVDMIFPSCFESILSGLSDPEDDVGAVSASALIPIASHLTRLLPDAVAPVITRLWKLLGEQDELAAACDSFMGLLAAVLGCAPAAAPASCDVAPRLWPYLSHGTSSVRRATLQTLVTLTLREIDWDASTLQDAMRHVFQRMLVEHVHDIRDFTERVWNNLVRNSGLAQLLHAACPYVSTWLCMTMQPGRIPYDSSVLIEAKSARKKEQSEGTVAVKYYVGGSETISQSIREENVTTVRCVAARMLGLLSCYVVRPAPGIVYAPEMESPIDCYVKVLLVYLQSKSALQRTVVGLVVSEWAKIDRQPCPDALRQRLHTCLAECIYFDELAVAFTRLIQETKDFIATMKYYKVWSENFMQDVTVLTLDQIINLSGPETAKIIQDKGLKTKISTSLEERRRNIYSNAQTTSKDQLALSVSTQAAVAAACVMTSALPEKLNPVIRPLMDAVKRENEVKLQEHSALALAHLAAFCVTREPCPNAKIVSNLCTLLCCDPEFTPKINPSEMSSSHLSGILTLINQQRSAERAMFKRSNSSTGRGPGRPPLTDIPLEELLIFEDETQKMNRIQRRGATLALTAITKHFGAELQNQIPHLWELMVGQLVETVDINHFYGNSDEIELTAVETLLYNLQVLEVCVGSLAQNLLERACELTLPRLTLLLSHPHKAIRHLSARCLAALARLKSVNTMEAIVKHVLPMLDAVHSDTRRQGSIEAIACVIDALQFNIIPYVVLLIVPILGRMSDQNECVRLIATHSFATLVQLMPLDGAVPDPPQFSEELKDRKEKERAFLGQLLNPSTIPDYVVPVSVNAQLRSYQQSGINWLGFLNKYKLHGILCDDMGLGKTLQSICILASDHHERERLYHETGSVDYAPLPSLVICPPTLTGHWVYEVEKFMSHRYLKALQYAGPPVEREKLRPKIKSYNLIVASYEIIRKDIDFFSSIKWNYCVLDEGHIIKNGKTKSSKAIKRLIANHRLILSGTPIQNNVLELWSLFDFLMPGFLGTEKQFTAKFSRPILASRDPKCSQKDQESGALAMEALHRQVLPFLLRRMKEDVLDDLPPKITQDYYCELSTLQEQLYEDFSKSRAHLSLQESLSGNTGAATNSGGNTHIFQALRYLQNVCNHPKLVLTPTHPLYLQITTQLRQQGTTLDNIQHAAKLPALKQLLLDLGIGTCSALGVNGTSSVEMVINQHRALIFCQLKKMLDILENDLFKQHLPGVAYLRLDGAVPPAQRHSLVTRFNDDPSIDVLLLTTQVGGLGLNLTGADTVIFVEHDWNPTRDLQAMDRAHRIGQRCVVNVYRLITRHTLEEKIMGLQKFKLLTANTVIGSDNASLSTMGTGNLFDLFSSGTSMNDAEQSAAANGQIGMRAMLDALPDLWDHRQYEDEYDLSQFVKNLCGTSNN